MNNPSHAFLAPQAVVDASQNYSGDYIITVTADCVILQELDTIVLNMSLED